MHFLSVIFNNLKCIYRYIFFLLILPEQFLKLFLTLNTMVQWQATCLLVLFLNFPFHSLILSLIINTSSFLADLFDTHTSMFTLFCRKASFCLCPFAPLETSTVEEKSIFYFSHKMRTKMLDFNQLPSTIDQDERDMGSDCTTFAASYAFLSGIRLCPRSERVRPARLWVWAGTRAPVMQTPPVSSGGLCAYSVHSEWFQKMLPLATAASELCGWNGETEHHQI